MSKRTCIITGKKLDPRVLLRFVVGPDGNLTPDIANKLPGRGAYIIPKPEYVREAIKKNKFARHIGFQKILLQKEIDSFIWVLESLLQRKFIEQIGLYRRRGIAVSGANNLKENPLLIGLLIASDASDRETKNIESVTNPNWMLRGIPSEILGKAFGRNSLAFAGIIGLKRAKSEFNGRSIKHSFQRWKSFIHVNSCQRGIDGCINEQSK